MVCVGGSLELLFIYLMDYLSASAGRRRDPRMCVCSGVPADRAIFKANAVLTTDIASIVGASDADWKQVSPMHSSDFRGSYKYDRIVADRECECDDRT